MCTHSCTVGALKLCGDDLCTRELCVLQIKLFVVCTPSCAVFGTRFPYKLGQLSSSNNIFSKAKSFAVFSKKKGAVHVS